jgi:hypothetical protein
LGFGVDVRCFFGTAIIALRGDGVVEGGTEEMKRAAAVACEEESRI